MRRLIMLASSAAHLEWFDIGSSMYYCKTVPVWCFQVSEKVKNRPFKYYHFEYVGIPTFIKCHLSLTIRSLIAYLIILFTSCCMKAKVLGSICSSSIWTYHWFRNRLRTPIIRHFLFFFSHQVTPISAWNLQGCVQDFLFGRGWSIGRNPFSR